MRELEKILKSQLYGEEAPKAASPIEAFRLLIARVRINPRDEEAVAVLSDACEEKGFVEAARSLRESEKGSYAFHKTLMALRILLGDGEEDKPTDERLAGRYTSLFGFPVTDVLPGGVVPIHTESQVTMRLRKIVLWTDAAPILVRDIRVGKNSLFHNSEGISSTLFTLNGPELFDEPVYIGLRVQITVENDGVSLTGRVRASALGLAMDAPSYSLPKYSLPRY